MGHWAWTWGVDMGMGQWGVGHGGGARGRSKKQEAEAGASAGRNVARRLSSVFGCGMSSNDVHCFWSLAGAGVMPESLRAGLFGGICWSEPSPIPSPKP